MSDRSSYETCVREVRAADRDRYFCALFAPAGARASLIALLAFNQELAKIPELVSEPMLGEIRLQWWREALEEVSAGAPRRHHVVLELAEAVRRHGLDVAELQACVEARAFDLDPAPPRSLDALVAHVRDTAGRINALWARCLAPGSEAAREAAEAAGVAFGLIGLARAVPHHGASERLYLPADRLAAAGLTPQAVFERRNPKATAGVIEAVCAAAADAMRATRRIAAGAPKAARPAFLPAALADLYRRRLARAGYDPVRMRDPGLLRRQLRALSAALFGRL